MSTKAKIGVIITNNQNQVLLIKEKLKDKPVPMQNIIKGTYGDNGNETVFETAIRECQEEAGVKIKLTHLLGCYVSQKPDKIRIQFNFLAEIIEGNLSLADKSEQESRDENISELKWFDKDELSKMTFDGFTSKRAYATVCDWLTGKSYPLELVKQVELQRENLLQRYNLFFVLIAFHFLISF